MAPTRFPPIPSPQKAWPGWKTCSTSLSFHGSSDWPTSSLHHHLLCPVGILVSTGQLLVQFFWYYGFQGKEFYMYYLPSLIFTAFLSNRCNYYSHFTADKPYLITQVLAPLRHSVSCAAQAIEFQTSGTHWMDTDQLPPTPFPNILVMYRNPDAWTV